MKKTLIIAALALVSAACFAQNKFAHVNFQELVMLAPEADEARATLNASQTDAQETYQAMVEEFQTKYQTYQQKASTWTPAIRESKEKELTDMQQRIQEFSQSIENELQQQQQRLMAPIYEKATATVKEIAKQAGYIYVFDESTALYVDPEQSDNITPAARKAMGIPEDRTMEQLQAELQQQAQQQM